MSDTKTFTVQDGLEVQAAHLVFWAELLKPYIFIRLKAAVKEATEAKELKTGHDVPRGTDIDSWIKNIHNDYNPLGR
jgi:hypothetical protein